MQINRENKSIIDIDSMASPAILAGLLDISVSMVSQGRQDGKIPAKVSATYRECIHQYIAYYKRKIASKSSSMMEAKLEQDIRNGIAKEELQWLQIKREKELLIDVNEFKDSFEPIFHLIKSSLVNLARKYPDTTLEIDNMLNTWFTLGEKMVVEANIDSLNYVQTMLDNELVVIATESKPLNTFE
jgi:hypothetical protein